MVAIAVARELRVINEVLDVIDRAGCVAELLIRSVATAKNATTA